MHALKNTMKIENDMVRKEKIEQELKDLEERTKTTFEKEMYERASIETISEIYDSKEPNEQRGAFAQAWSVAEILRIVFNK